ncbi:hypothetical protein [Pandoraea sputorum]|uniref:hypothetical protein n=1 Tax=Pandoraea sputorum TaxID=93222 RepID=UPI00123F36DB|nr:hypothetical protein [Pandoraea sputorum]VVE79600.1 hypothetical protein PSP31120_02315 [Pandoraea sputorum]
MNASTRATQIATFALKITSGTERLYNNGLSQVRIEILIEADSTLTPEEEDSLQLVDATTRQLIPAVDSSVPVTTGWGTSKQKNIFDFCPPGAALQEAVAPEPFHRYLQTADFANARKTVGARITLAGSGGPGIDVYSMDISGSDGEVDVVPVQFQRPGLSAWMADWESPDRFDVGPNIKVTVYHLGIVDSGGRYNIRTIEVAPGSHASMFRWLSPNSVTGAFCGYALPPDEFVQQHPFVYSDSQYMGDYRPTTNNYYRTGCASAVLVSRVGGLPWSGGANKQPCVYVLRDQYGTTHRMRLNIEESLKQIDLTQG